MHIFLRFTSGPKSGTVPANPIEDSLLMEISAWLIHPNGNCRYIRVNDGKKLSSLAGTIFGAHVIEAGANWMRSSYTSHDKPSTQLS